METKFDANVAQSLIGSMNKYCTCIQRDAKDILKLLDSGKGWKDPQFLAFSEAIHQICTDLDKTLKLESEYLITFQERVDELR